MRKPVTKLRRTKIEPVLLKITYNPDSGFHMDPPDPHIDSDDIAVVIAVDKACRICFSPSDTILGRHLDLLEDEPIAIKLGPDAVFEVSYSLTDFNANCGLCRQQPEARRQTTLGDGGGTIIVGN
jgi:hypothetical protein